MQFVTEMWFAFGLILAVLGVSCAIPIVFCWACDLIFKKMRAAALFATFLWWRKNYSGRIATLGELPFPLWCHYPRCAVSGPFANPHELCLHVAEKHWPSAIWSFACTYMGKEPRNG